MLRSLAITELREHGAAGTNPPGQLASRTPVQSWAGVRGGSLVSSPPAESLKLPLGPLFLVAILLRSQPEKDNVQVDIVRRVLQRGQRVFARLLAALVDARPIRVRDAAPVILAIRSTRSASANRSWPPRARTASDCPYSAPRQSPRPAAYCPLRLRVLEGVIHRVPVRAVHDEGPAIRLNGHRGAIAIAKEVRQGNRCSSR